MIKIKSYKIKDLHDEDKVTIEYMEKYGINNVRGGSFCNIKLSEAEKEVLRKMIKTQNNKCFKCGQDGHYSNKCTEEWIDVSDSESESEYESEERYNKCFRCNRKGHMRNNCYAKTDVYGNKLYDESEDEDISIDEEYEDDSAQSLIDKIFGKNFNTVSYLQQNAYNSFILMNPSEKLNDI